MLFELNYMQIWNCFVQTRDWNRNSLPLKYVSVLCELPNKPTVYEKPIDMKLDMCDANVQKHQFSNLPAY